MRASSARPLPPRSASRRPDGIAGSRTVDLARILILNTGVSVTAPLIIAANNLVGRGIPVARANILDLGHSAAHVLESRIGSHANEHETSLPRTKFATHTPPLPVNESHTAGYVPVFDIFGIYVMIPNIR